MIYCSYLLPKKILGFWTVPVFMFCKAIQKMLENVMIDTEKILAWGTSIKDSLPNSYIQLFTSHNSKAHNFKLPKKTKKVLLYVVGAFAFSFFTEKIYIFLVITENILF